MNRVERLQQRVDKLTEIINRPDPDRRWREAGLVLAGVLVGVWIGRGGRQ